MWCALDYVAIENNRYCLLPKCRALHNACKMHSVDGAQAPDAWRVILKGRMPPLCKQMYLVLKGCVLHQIGPMEVVRLHFAHSTPSM